MIEFIIKFLSKLLSPQKLRKKCPKTSEEMPENFGRNPVNSPQDEIDWLNPEAKISKYFKVKEALYLPSWKIYHIPTMKEKEEILKLAKKMDILRDKFGKIIVNVWIRPIKVNAPGTIYHDENYNKAIGGKSFVSGHIFGKAIDFYFKGEIGVIKCGKMREKLIPQLEPLNLRMEDRTGNWVHIDSKPMILKRYFKP